MRTTKFSKMEPDYLAKSRWASYYHAGTDWIMVWQLLVEARKKEGSDAKLITAPAPFYVDTYIIQLCLELYTKSLIAYSNPDFDPKEYGHSTIKYIQKYKNISPIFKRISEDSSISTLIKEYEKTKDTKYGETYVEIGKGDPEKVMTLVYEMREEIKQKAGFPF